MKWPWPSFHAALGNLLPGDVIVVAGRNASGKTMFAMNLALKWGVEEQGRISYLALECGPDLPLWFGLMQTGEPRFAQRQDEKVDAILRAREWSRDAWPPDLDVVDLAFPSPDLLVERVDSDAEGARVVIVDHLAAVDTSGSFEERRAYARVMRRLKVVAEAREIPIVVMHQMGRGERQRAEKYRPPNIDNLYGSAIIEHTASVVLGLYRTLDETGRGLLMEYNKGAPIPIWQHEQGMGVHVSKARHGAKRYDLRLIPESVAGHKTDRLMDDSADYDAVNQTDMLRARQP